MLNFLPQVYENELFYSIIARYQRMCGMVSKRALVKDVFGKYVLISSTYFPIYINYFIQNLPPSSKMTTREIILNHTMFTFYTAFLNPKKTEYIYDLMKNGSNSINVNIEQLIGFGGSKVRKSKFLRYCPICFKEDLELLGESYWRTSHQIVGVYYCSKHQVLLKDSTVPSTGNGLDFVCADKQVCDTSLLEDRYIDKFKELNLKYVNNAEFLIKSNFTRKELNYINAYYIDRLRERGLASYNGTIYLKKFQEQFIKYYSNHYLALMQSYINPVSPSNWLGVFVRNNQKNKSPLRHLLLLQFLNLSPCELFSNIKVIGKKRVKVNRIHIDDLDNKRKMWLELIENNPSANRTELKSKAKGLYTWLIKYDWDWYDKVTPKLTNRKRRKRSENLEAWKEKDEEYLKLAKEAVDEIMSYTGKPVRVTPTRIRKMLGFGSRFPNEKLVKTRKFLHEVKEDIDNYRIRKIRWAIKEMSKKGLSITPYKVQLYAGFGGINSEHIRGLINNELNKKINNNR